MFPKPANFGLSELTVFTSTRPDTPPHASVERRAINVKEFVGQTPRERSMELDAEERDAEKALREAQLQATRVWLRQVEEENEDKLRERLAEQRKMQQEHFKKLVRRVKKSREGKVYSWCALRIYKMFLFVCLFLCFFLSFE